MPVSSVSRRSFIDTGFSSSLASQSLNTILDSKSISHHAYRIANGTLVTFLQIIPLDPDLLSPLIRRETSHNAKRLTWSPRNKPPRPPS
jgi:hypothetical protein